MSFNVPRRTLSPRTLGSALLLAALMLLSAPAAVPGSQARAQWATIDMTNAIAMGKQFVQLKNQIETMRGQYATMKRNLREMEDMTSWRADEWLGQVEAAQDRLGAMTYVLGDIDQRMGEVYGTEAYEDYAQEHREQLERTLATMRTAVGAMRSHRLQIEDGIDEIARLKEDNARAGGNRQALQAQTNAVLYQIESLQMLREQISTMTNVMAVQGAQRLSERMQQKEAGRRSNESLKNSARPALRSRPLGSN